MKTIFTSIFASFIALAVVTGVPVIKQNAALKAEAKVTKRKANRICRKKYGRKFIRSRISRSGKITCIYRSGPKPPAKLDYQTVTEYCQKKYKFYESVKAIKRNGKWGCTGIW